MTRDRTAGRGRALPLSRVYGLLEPGPVVLLATHWRGRSNVMAMSWHTMLDFEPPLLGCVVSDRNHSFGMLMASRECVIGIPTAKLAKKVVGCGNASGATLDKFAAFRLTALAGTRVRAPLIGECFANLECLVTDTRMVRKYGLFVLEVQQAWMDPEVRHPRTLHHLGRGRFMVAGRRLQLPSAMR